MSVFTHRIPFKPFEYPEILQFRDAIHQSIWTFREYSFISDIQDYYTKATPLEQKVLRNTILAISQIEVEVKKFWAKLGDRFPKAEFDQVSAAFADSEARHAAAYSELLEKLHLNEEFRTLKDKPCIQGRLDYLGKYMQNLQVHDDIHRKKFSSTLTLFSIFIEFVSLFSQFAIIRSFNKFRKMFKDIDTVIQSTQKEEEIHAKFGMWLVNQIRNEFPEWFDSEFETNIHNSCRKALQAEIGVLDWIFEDGELDYITKNELIEFMKDRFNKSLKMIGLSEIFNVDQDILNSTEWFYERAMAEVETDFFHKRPPLYAKNVQSFTEEDLF